MDKSLKAFRATLLVGWMALCVAGVLYARIRGVPSWAATPALAAFLVEYAFYLVPAFPTVRERVAGWRLPAFLVASAVLPYLACCCGAVPFRWIALAQLIALALVLGLWYFVLPPSAPSDIGFGALVAWVLLGNYFAGIYPAPYPHVEVAILGKVAVFQSAVLVLMLKRRVPETGYGFLPTLREWRIGALHFLYFIPVGLPLALAIHAVRFAKPAPLWVIVGTLLGFLWVVALAEEFLFRGVLQPFMEQWTRNRQAALLSTSLLFGLAHLWFRSFPNWRWVLVAGTLGWFCGRARNQAGGIRAAVVTHTLTVTAWRAFFA
jgi:membrane protease YdiL (CAAX protease family)